jgi:hypothetical protein
MFIERAIHEARQPVGSEADTVIGNAILREARYGFFERSQFHLTQTSIPCLRRFSSSSAKSRERKHSWL